MTTQAEPPRPPKTITLHVEFTGGLELLFANTRKHTINLPVTNPTALPTCGALVAHLSTHALHDHPQRSMFVLDDDFARGAPGGSMTVRPGILVMVNDADWALEGEEACTLADGDEVVFVSTLHGG